MPTSPSMTAQGLEVRVLPSQKLSAKAATFRWRSMLAGGRAAACSTLRWKPWRGSQRACGMKQRMSSRQAVMQTWACTAHAKPVLGAWNGVLLCSVQGHTIAESQLNEPASGGGLPHSAALRMPCPPLACPALICTPALAQNLNLHDMHLQAS